MNTEHADADSLVLASSEETSGTDALFKETLSDIRGHDTLSIYYARIARIRLLSPEEEAELSRRVLVEKDILARNKLVEHNLRLSRWVAAKFSRRKLPFEDLIQEGNIGLIKAAKKFDYKRKVRFTVYAVWWIRESIWFAITNNWELVRVPRYIVGLQYKVLNTFNIMTQQTGRKPTFEELAEEVELPARKVRQVILSSLGRVNSLEDPTFGRGGVDASDDIDESVLGQTLADKTILGPELAVQAKKELLSAHLRIKSVLDAVVTKTKLPERNLLIFKMRYALDGAKEPYTLRQIGNRVGVTPEAVRQIINNVWQRIGVESREEFLQDLFRVQELEKLVAG